MMRIFLDVGAHIGQTAAEVLKPEYQFDRVVCFEPVPICCQEISEKYSDERLTVNAFGLFDKPGRKKIYGGGNVGGTLFSDKQNADKNKSIECVFENASLWLQKNVNKEDEVYMKLNCEGAECNIIDDLLKTGAIELIDHIMVDFDVRKIPSQQWRERETRDRLRELRAPKVYISDEVMIGESHGCRINNWLLLAGAIPEPSTIELLKAYARFYYQKSKLLEQKIRQKIKSKNK